MFCNTCIFYHLGLDQTDSKANFDISRDSGIGKTDNTGNLTDRDLKDSSLVSSSIAPFSGTLTCPEVHLDLPSTKKLFLTQRVAKITARDSGGGGGSK